MKILLISDIHGRVEMAERLMAAINNIDGIVVAGDITNFGGCVEAAAVMQPILAKNIPIAAVAGNCDTDEVEDYLADKKINLQRQYIRQGGVVFVGAGGSLPCPKTTPHEYGDNVLETTLSKAFWQAKESSPDGQKDSLVVVTHQPALGTKVDSVGGRHTGSPAIRRFIEVHQPILAVSGHIHEAFGVDKIANTTLVNPGPLKEGRYAIVELQDLQATVELKQL
jgi:Icc-related predicted phosphoesterase